VDELVFRLSTDAVRARLGTVRLRLVDEQSGEPLTDGTASLTDRQGAGGERRIAADGAVEFVEQAPGIRELRVRSRDHAVLSRRVRVEPGITLELGDIAVSRLATVAGRVVDENGAGVATSLTAFPVDRIGMVQDVETNWVSRSAADGSFELSAPQARIAVVVTGGEWGSRPILVDASSGRVEAIEIPVVRGVEVRFRPADDALADARFTLATGAGLPFRSQRLGSSLPFAQRIAPGTYQIWLGWDEHVVERLTVAIPPTADGRIVVELPALERAR
jgi:hypothetical protein